MLETIRQFAEEQLAAFGEADTVRAAHSRYFAGKENDILALWDSPRQRKAYEWFTVELANLRAAFRWSADHGELDVAIPIATYAALLGLMVENYEPIAWTEELIEPAHVADHPRLAFLYVMASQSWMVGRVKESVGYSGRPDGSPQRPQRGAVRLRELACRCIQHDRPARAVCGVVPRSVRTRS
jgi:hypothetical protein